jgi:signal transduction histidine kinase
MAGKKIKKTKISEPGSILAHQLKNPISVLNGYLEMLISEELGELNDKQKEYLADAIENVKTMSKTVNDILNVSKIEEGHYKLKPKSVELAKVVQDVIDELLPWIKASNVEIDFKKPEKKLKAFVDPVKIRYVIENIISNSVRYKGPGTGHTEIKIEEKDGKVLFSCKDKGIGIPKKDADKMFSKYYRSEDAVNLYPAGTGLGLYISKAIIELSDGKIWFENNKGKGMTFYFSLPAA